jgi:hypothetical protein
VNRSGSTYLANLLDSSPKILACPEGDVLVTLLLENPGGAFNFNDRIKSRLINIFSTDPKLKSWGEGKSLLTGLDESKTNLEAFFSILINYKNQVKQDADFILFKAERIIYLVRKIQKINLEHNIRFISIIRDPRAVFASQKRTFYPGTSNVMSNSAVKLANCWKRFVSLSYLFNGKNFLIIRFEGLIADYMASFNFLSEFFRIELAEVSPEKGNLLKRMPAFQVNIHNHIQKKPLIRKIDEWKNELTSQEIFMIEKVSGKFLFVAGYNAINNKPGLKIYFFTVFQTYNLHFKKFLKKVNFHVSRVFNLK